MPLKLIVRPAANISVRGAHMGVSVYRSTGTRDPALAEQIRVQIRSEIERDVWGIERQNPFDYVSERLANPDMDYTYIYVFQSLEYVKIGLADNPAARRELLALGNPHGLKLIQTRRIRKTAALMIESRIHALLAAHAVGREWFKTTPENAIAAMDEYDASLMPLPPPPKETK